MEQKRSKRKFIRTKTEIASDENIFEGVIKNISAKGIYVRVDAGKSKIKFNPGKILKLKFKHNSSETLNLRCIIKWSNIIPTYGLTYDIGLEILDPSFNNKEVYKTLE
jgi:hypothetical protein